MSEKAAAKRIAIVGGGISGLAAAYELELARRRGAPIDWHLYEATDRLGGIVETTRFGTPEGEWILEGGPDAWVTEKPWARDLSIELGLEQDIIPCNEADKRTYIYLEGKLVPLPDRMRMMVPSGPDALSTLDNSPLFSAAAKQAYADELARAEELKASAPQQDESVASFIRRHFGDEVLEKVGAPLLSGVFGGDVHKLSVRAVMPAFVAMEREHGSLILATQRRAAELGDKPAQPTFTTLRRGMGSLADAILRQLPPERLHLNSPAQSIKREGKLFCLRYSTPSGRGGPGKSKKHFRHVLLATPADATRSLLQARQVEAAALIPTDASSAVLTTFCWPADIAQTFSVPPGFGFLVPQTSAPTLTASSRPECEARSGETPVFLEASATREPIYQPQILAATFTNQKFPNRTPAGARAIRVFFGTGSAEYFANTPDTKVAQTAFDQLTRILGPLPTPDPNLTTVRRWPRSLPQYEIGHLDRMAQLDDLIARTPGLHLLGNSYRGVGVPDLIRDAREAVRKLIS